MHCGGSHAISRVNFSGQVLGADDVSSCRLRTLLTRVIPSSLVSGPVAVLVAFASRPVNGCDTAAYC